MGSRAPSPTTAFFGLVLAVVAVLLAAVAPLGAGPLVPRPDAGTASAAAPSSDEGVNLLSTVRAASVAFATSFAYDSASALAGKTGDSQARARSRIVSGAWAGERRYDTAAMPACERAGVLSVPDREVSATRSSGVADDLAGAACSFSGATLVLMADGSRKPIEDVEVGDTVFWRPIRRPVRPSPARSPAFGSTRTRS